MYQLFSFWAVGNLPSMFLRTGDESEERGKHRGQARTQTSDKNLRGQGRDVKR